MHSAYTLKMRNLNIQKSEQTGFSEKTQDNLSHPQIEDLHENASLFNIKILTIDTNSKCGSIALKLLHVQEKKRQFH